ncbi:hypothetical protein JRQ81_001403 [Phrynocephalus forsythii]|uniref:Uncharacterized protein n=1 Tax=Phrynocephalus forsythii TaxID=171643 RepID=A0A9Q1B7U7_9SAUR|nr:hypothetical protein JRQ81_001403 [Phrynocephalus forsythii]
MLQVELHTLQDLAQAILAYGTKQTSEKRPRLLEECYEGETNPRKRTQIPLRIAVRKLSFHFRPQLTKETTWSQDTAYKGIPRDRWAEFHQDRRTRQEHLDHNGGHKQALDPTLEDMSRDASELWCEKSHVTFDGGFSPKKKTFCSVAPRRLKNAYGKETKPSVDPGFFPPLQTRTHSEGDGVTKKYRKQVPPIFQLPQISQDSPRAPWKKADPTELPKELVVLPLLTFISGETLVTFLSYLSETCCTQSVPKVAACDEPGIPLLNNLPFQWEQRHRQDICGGLPGAAQDSFRLPLIPNGELTRMGRRIQSSEAYNPEQVCEHQRESHNGISLSNSIMDPERQIVCPTLLGSVQTTDHPGQFGPVPNNEGEDAVLNEEETISRHPPETSAVEELDDKETIQVFAALKNRGSALCAERSLGLLLTQQAGKPPENRKGFGQEPSAMGSESLSLQHGKENQQSQGGLCRSSHLQQSKVEKGPSLWTQTARPEPKNGIGIAQDTGKALDNMPLSAELDPMEPNLACPTISEWEMESVPQANHIVMKLLDHSGEFKESLTTDAWTPEKHFGMEDKAALPENANNKAKAAGLSRAPVIIENTRVPKRTKRELTAAGSVSKAQKKRTKKEEHKSQVIVPGKPRQKRAAKKTGVHFKEKLDVEGSETGDEPNEEEGKRQGDVDMEQFDPVVEEESGSGEGIEGEGEGGGEVGKDNDSLGSPSVRSHPPSRSTKEAGPLLLQEGRPVAEKEGHSPGSHNCPAQERPVVFHLQDFEAHGSQTEAGHSSGLPEDSTAKREEARQSRERMIAERAEKGGWQWRENDGSRRS